MAVMRDDSRRTAVTGLFSFRSMLDLEQVSVSAANQAVVGNSRTQALPRRRGWTWYGLLRSIFSTMLRWTPALRVSRGFCGAWE